MNYFVLCVVFLFVCGAVAELAVRNYPKSLFYLLSGLINVVALFLK
jgi:hypothetical protein